MNLRHLILILGLSILPLGCGGETYRALPSERDDPTLRHLLEAGRSHPMKTLRFRTVVGRDPAMVIALHETGCDATDRAVVLLHGCSSDHETWRFLAGDLGADHRLILVDLPGCGASECPNPAALADDAYSPGAMAQRVLQALDTYFAGREAPEHITLVGHSLGGQVALRMMGARENRRRYPRVLGRVDRMVLLSPLDVEFPDPPEVLRELATVSSFTIALGDVTGILKKRVALSICDSVYNGRRALREDADRLCAALTQPSRLHAFQAILTQALPTDGDELDWPAVRRIVADYANVDVPCLILWGALDDTLPVEMGYKLAGEIPTAELYVVDDCKHSLQLEYPRLCASVIRDFSVPPHPLVHAVAPGALQTLSLNK